MLRASGNASRRALAVLACCAALAAATPLDVRSQAYEPKRAQPAPKAERAEPPRPPSSPPSPAQQFQQQQYEQRQLQQQKPVAQKQRAAHCSAYPVCARQSGGYGSCQGVEQQYASAGQGRQDIVEQCIRANTPDSCNCAAQCSRVAQCSIF